MVTDVAEAIVVIIKIIIFSSLHIDCTSPLAA